MNIKLFIVAGESSGDTHAANVVKELKKEHTVELYGTGGAQLLAEGQVQYATVEDMAAIGFDQAIKKLPMLWRLAGTLQKKIEEIQPDLILTVDYNGFNLRLAKRLKKYNIPIVQFVSPQFWIWNYSRVYVLRDYIEKVLCILPFEEELLKKENVNAVYIGNPITDGIKFKYSSREEFFCAHKCDPDKFTIGLMPGSRLSELRALMPVLTQAALQVGKDVQFILAKADSISMDALRGYIPPELKVEILSGETHDVMKYSDILWICSGTATLEASIIGTPMIIVYQSSAFNLFIMKRLTSMRMAGMVNIISNRYVVPELIGPIYTMENLLKTHNEMIHKLDSYRSDLAPIAKLFAGRTPLKNAADEIIKSIKQQ